jgi:hypothetical protein
MRNFSGERKGINNQTHTQMLIQNYVNVNINQLNQIHPIQGSKNTIPQNNNSKLKEILEEENGGIDNLMRKKILKKKEKIKTNILNYTNPYNSKHANNLSHKLHLETSAHNNPSYLSKNI